MQRLAYCILRCICIRYQYVRGRRLARGLRGGGGCIHIPCNSAQTSYSVYPARLNCPNGASVIASTTKTSQVASKGSLLSLHFQQTGHQPRIVANPPPDQLTCSRERI